jgi:hypothetical protein
MECFVRRISSDILAKIFNYANCWEGREAFVNFWIACLGCGDMNLNTNAALFSIEINHFLEKKDLSTLSQYLSNIYFYDQADDREFSENNKSKNSFAKYCDKLALIQKNRPRVAAARIICSPYQVENKVQQSIFDSLKKFPRLKALHISIPELKLSLLQKLPRLRFLFTSKLNADLAENTTFPNIMILQLSNLTNFQLFPNLTKLLLKNIQLESLPMNSTVDLSNLKYLEKLILTYAEDRDIDILLQGSNLESITIKNTVKIINLDAEFFVKLVHFKISPMQDDFQPKFRSEDLFANSKNLKKLDIGFIGKASDVDRSYNTPIFSKILEQANKFVNITSLSMINFNASYTLPAPTPQENPFEPLKHLVNILNLRLENFVMRYDSMKIFEDLCSKVTKLTWRCVLQCDYASLDYIAPSAKILANIESLDADMLSCDWHDLIEILVQIKFLNLTNKEVCKETLHDFNNLIDPMFYGETPVNPDKFLLEFHIERFNRVGKMLDSFRYNDRICNIFHFEEKSYDGHELAFRSDSMRKTTVANILLEDHNNLLREHYVHDYDETEHMLCDHENAFCTTQMPLSATIQSHLYLNFSIENCLD